MQPVLPDFSAEELRRTNERLKALLDLTLQLGSERDPQRLVENLCRPACEIIGARFALVGVLDGDGTHLRCCLSSGTESATHPGLPDPRQGPFGAVLDEGRCRRLRNPTGDPAAVGLASSFPAFRSFLAAPLLSPTRVHGWLCLIDKLGAEEFSDEDERMAGVLAAQVGRSYENNSLYAEVLRHAAELEREVGERRRAEEAVQEKEEQYRQAQKMEVVGRLAGGVAHDFNNLLTVINGYGELVLDRLAAGDPAREMICEMVAAGSRAAGLTRQLLAFSRKALLEPKVLDLAVVVGDVDKMLRRILGEDIQLAVLTDPNLGAVKADPGQVEQVLLNLVVNARDAMPRGGKLTIELLNAELDETYARDHPDVQAGPYVLLAVSDTGCGMDRETMTHIFEPFFTTKGKAGTGLGLATVHGIVKQSGGHVAVYSEVGRGTTFHVYLPRVGHGRPAGKSQPGTVALPRGSETVLLVEDEDAVRALARHVLQSCGYTLLEAGDGAEAVRLAGQHHGPIDLLVTDVVLPQMGGREVAERVTALSPAAKVLFLSGYTDDAVVRHGILEAHVAFLHKPFRPASLAAKVREVLDAS